MLIQIAFVLLCLAQILHFSVRWLQVTRSILEERDLSAHADLAERIDWNRPAGRQSRHEAGDSTGLFRR